MSPNKNNKKDKKPNNVTNNQDENGSPETGPVTLDPKLVTAIQDTVRDTINVTLDKKLEDFNAKFASLDSKLEEVEAKFEIDERTTERWALLNRFTADRQEQYSRRNSIRIHGIKQREGEDEEALEAAIIQVAAFLEVTLTPDDIDIAHRLPGPRNDQTGGNPSQKTKSIIMKLVRRKKKLELLKNKHKLKGYEHKVFFTEDLTPLRAKLFKYVKEQPNVKKVVTHEGKIRAMMKGDDKKTVDIDSPDDLFHIGIDEPDWDKLRLTSWFF